MTEPRSLGADFFQTPHRYLTRLRPDGPAHRVVLPSGMTVWLVIDHAEGKKLLADPRLSKARERRAELMVERGGPPPVIQRNSALSSHMLASDPPDHTRLRALVNRAFTARRIAEMRTRIEAITAELLDTLPIDTEFDLLARFAQALPVSVISDLIGVPTSGRDQFRAWLDTLFTSGRDERDYEQSSDAFLDHLQRLIARAREEPGDDLVTALVHARDGADELSEDELLSSVGLLISAGYETTANLIASSVYNLLCHPREMAAVRADPRLIPGAVEESLRIDGPVYLSTARFTRTDVTCGPVVIPAHEIVLIALLAANHDPARFRSPDAFDVERSENPHLAFGHGIHFCLGAQLARLETEIALRGLLTRFDDIALGGQPQSLRWRESLVIHGLERLPVRLRTSS